LSRQNEVLRDDEADDAVAGGMALLLRMEVPVFACP
jgi:hypothetical protein